MNAPADPGNLVAATAHTFARHPSARVTATAWLRRTHGWIGLWGAALGLLFGLSGIWLNHRAVLPLQVAQARTSAQLALPDPAPADATALATWLQGALHLDAPNNVRVEPARPVAWEEPASRDRGVGSAPAPAHGTLSPPAMGLTQPGHWALNFGGPRNTVQVEYWVGNRSVSVRRTSSGFIGTLTNLHKGVGMPVGWILLVDTLAGSLVLLSLSGLALWMLTRRRRTVGLALFGASLALMAGLALSRI